MDIARLPYPDEGFKPEDRKRGAYQQFNSRQGDKSEEQRVG
jgi:hypothetical protein